MTCMVPHYCQSKKINKIKKKERKIFLQKKKINKKNLKNSAQKNKIKNVYWAITAKMTNSNQFPIKHFLTPHRYKRTLRVQPTSS